MTSAKPSLILFPVVELETSHFGRALAGFRPCSDFIDHWHPSSILACVRVVPAAGACL